MTSLMSYVCLTILIPVVVNIVVKSPNGTLILYMISPMSLNRETYAKCIRPKQTEISDLGRFSYRWPTTGINNNDQEVMGHIDGWAVCSAVQAFVTLVSSNVSHSWLMFKYTLCLEKGHGFFLRNFNKCRQGLSNLFWPKGQVYKF